METLQLIFAEYEAKEKELRFRNPSFSFWYNWLIVGLVIALFIGFVKWGIDIHTNNAAEQAKAELLAAIDEENAQLLAAAEEQQRQAEKEAAEFQIREAKAVARALFGIRNFASKYGYTNDDLLTYARCVTNRAEATGKTVEEVLAEEGQFIAYSEHNDLETEYYNLALQFIADWHNGQLKPCDLKFKYAVLKDNGIWLVDDPNKTIPERWHV